MTAAWALAGGALVVLAALAVLYGRHVGRGRHQPGGRCHGWWRVGWAPYNGTGHRRRPRRGRR